MPKWFRVAAVVVGFAGCACAGWPTGEVHFGPGGPGEWGLGLPSPWLVYTYTPAGFRMTTEFVTVSAGIGLMGLICLAYGIAPRRRSPRPSRTANSAAHP